MSRTPERQKFLTDVIVTAVEGGIQHWAKVRGYHFEYKDLGDSQDTARAEIREIETMNLCWTPINPDVIEVALEKFHQPLRSLADTYRMSIVAADQANDSGEIDADLADCIVQMAVLGDVGYG